MTRRYLVLPRRGTLLVGTDLHGNLEDFARLRQLLLAELDADPEAHLALLGDLVHGPDGWAREQWPKLYDFDDQSERVVAELCALRRRLPGRVHLVLGNHDYGHVGGPHTSKFHPDEVSHLEARLDPGELEQLRRLFQGALLLLLAPCGVVLSHGSPDDGLHDLQQLEHISLTPGANDMETNALLRSLLTAYGQPGEVTARLLAQLSRSTGLTLSLVVHGHDKDEAGYFEEGGNQVCPVIFGAPRHEKRYLRLNLEARYTGPADLAEGREVLRLYPKA